MKTKRRAHLAYLFITFVLLSPVLTRADVLTGTVTGVVDGNTFTVRLGKGQQQLISLIGVAAPELGDCFGPASRSWLSDLTLGKKVRLEPANTGGQQQILVKLLLADRDVNLEIIRHGFARYNKEHELWLGEKERQAYQSAEAQARSTGIGLWSSPTPESACVNPNQQADELQPVEPAQGFPGGVKFYGRVTETYGGNGIAVMTDDRARRAVCISYLETPEPGQPYAEIAAQHLKDLLLGKEVTVLFRGFSEEATDCVIGDVYLGGVNVTLQMVRDGAAWANKGYAYLEGYYIYEQAEQAARGERRGLWQDPSPTPPWTYRAQHPSDGGGSPGGGFYGNSGTRNADGRVHVRGYTRRDGTYVQPHTRSYPTRRH